jgi:hypothetical protein
MDWLNQIRGVLSKYADRQPEPPEGKWPGVLHTADTSAVHRDFEEVAHRAPRSALAEGLAAAFRMEDAPPFGQSVAHLFSQADADRKADLLNRVLSIAPSSASREMLNFLTSRKISPEEAQTVPPNKVERLANEAQQKNPAVVDRVADFFAEHPNLVKKLSVGTLAAVIASIGRRAGSRTAGGRTAA